VLTATNHAGPVRNSARSGRNHLFDSPQIGPDQDPTALSCQSPRIHRLECRPWPPRPYPQTRRVVADVRMSDEPAMRRLRATAGSVPHGVRAIGCGSHTVEFDRGRHPFDAHSGRQDSGALAAPSERRWSTSRQIWSLWVVVRRSELPIMGQVVPPQQSTCNAICLRADRGTAPHFQVRLQPGTIVKLREISSLKRTTWPLNQPRLPTRQASATIRGNTGQLIWPALVKCCTRLSCDLAHGWSVLKSRSYRMGNATRGAYSDDGSH